MCLVAYCGFFPSSAKQKLTMERGIILYESRKKQVLQMFEKKEPLRVKDIQDVLQVSAMTVQRDLVKMENEGLISKGFGEITRGSEISLEHLMVSREPDFPEVQMEIAAAAKDLIQNGDTVYFGHGTIIYELAKQAQAKKVMAVTTSLRAAVALYNSEGTVYLTGGVLANEARSLFGEYAERSLQNFYLDKAFITCAALNNRGELCEATEEEVRLKKILFKHTKRTILLLENDKFGFNKVFTAGTLADIFMVVTNKPLSKTMLTLMKENGVSVLYTFGDSYGPQLEAEDVSLQEEV